MLCEMQHIGHLELLGGPVIVYARHKGKYVRPVVAYNIDMRIEDNPAIPRTMLLGNAAWYARHPIEPLYMVCDGGVGHIYTRVTKQEVAKWLRQRPVARPLPTKGEAAWWEWVVALDQDYNMIKAAKRPREFEPTPEEVDERGGEHATLETRLHRIFV